MARNKKAERNVRQLWGDARNYLIQHLQPTNRYAFAQGTPSAYNNSMGNMSVVPARPGQVNFLSGHMPSEAGISQFLSNNPAYRQAVAAVKRGRGGGGQRSALANVQPAGPYDPTVTARPGVQGHGDLATQATAAFMQQQNQANAMNELRYQQLLGEQEALRERRQSRAENWGEAASQDIDERMQDALKEAKANAADRGLANTNVVDAYRLRAAQNTAREQQRVSEMRDDRMNNYDAQDTANLQGFIERRTDIGPDQSQLLALMQAFGASGAAGAGAVAPTGPLVPQPPVAGGGVNPLRMMGGGGIPPKGGAMPLFLNGNPLQGAQMMMANPVIQQLGIGSNAYPGSRPYAPKVPRNRKVRDRSNQAAAHGPHSAMANSIRRRRGLPMDFVGQVPDDAPYFRPILNR